MPDLVVAGAGMAGLVAAAQARERGAQVELLEKFDRPGGSMLLSSGVAWRHLDFKAFRQDCPDGDPGLQRLIFERLDEDLRWLRSLGASPIGMTGNPRTTGLRFDPAQLTEVLVKHAGPPSLDSALTELPEKVPVVLATGGFSANRALLQAHVTPEADRLMLRCAPGATGDGLKLGLAAGARRSAGMRQAYGRNMPAPPAQVGPNRFVSAAQLYAHDATLRNEHGEAFHSRHWSEIDAFQWTARQPGARAWFEVETRQLSRRHSGRTIGSMIDAATQAGAAVVHGPTSVRVETVAGVTTTLGGLLADQNAMVAPGVFAAGQDVGGIATGGYSSGLASALVLGRVAADAALGIA